MVLSILLSLIGIVAILAEFFIPSAGIIGLAGAGAIVSGIVLVFKNAGSLAGFLFFAANALVVPAIIIAYWKRFPRSFMGKRLILAPPADELRSAAKLSIRPAIGDEGRALTSLRPAGMALFGSERLSVVTSGAFLEKDSPLRVVDIEGTRIVVEPSD